MPERKEPELEIAPAGEEVRQMVEEMEHGSRSGGLAHYLVPGLAAAWSLFQLSLPYFITLDTVYVRAVHLAFAITLVYLSYPALKRRKLTGYLAFLSEKVRVPVLDAILAGVAAMAALYYALDYIGISGRAGLPLPRDLVAGVVLIVLLLEAARRALGPALPVVAGTFLLYALFAQHAPPVIAFRSVSLDRLISQLTLSTEGIYGVPLYVSASTVFLFVLFGAMLDKTGGGEYFVRLSFSMLGTFKGGPGKAAVLASGLTGTVSGSSIANVVTTGTFTIPLMKRAGYPPVKAGAIEVAASTNGQLMPPIMGAAAFIIAEYVGIPYLEVVRAAIVPALLSYLALIYITHLEASKLGLRGLPRSELPPFWDTFKRGIHFLVPLTLLLYLLIIRRYSPELAAFWSLLALVGAVALYNLWGSWREASGVRAALQYTARQVWDGLVGGGRNMMSIGVAVAAAGIIVGVVSLGPGQRITEAVDHVAGGNIYLILFLTAIASLILGMGLPTTANYIVMASLTAQVIVVLAADANYAVPLIAAHLFVFYFGILADDTPPVGLAAYAASAIAGSDPIRTGIRGFTYDMRTALLPFMFFFNTDLLLWGVTGWGNILAIFFGGLVGMFAFAALLANWMIVRNRLHEALLLGLCTLLMLQPLIFEQHLQLHQYPALGAIPWENRWLWKGTGIALFLLVMGLQWRRSGQAQQPATA